MEYLPESGQPADAAQQLLQRLRESDESSHPVDKLLELQRDLIALEQEYGLSSEDFSRRYHAGMLEDEVDGAYWVGRYRQYQQLKSVLYRAVGGQRSRIFL